MSHLDTNIVSFLKITSTYSNFQNNLCHFHVSICMWFFSRRQDVKLPFYKFQFMGNAGNCSLVVATVDVYTDDGQ